MTDVIDVNFVYFAFLRPVVIVRVVYFVNVVTVLIALIGMNAVYIFLYLHQKVKQGNDQKMLCLKNINIILKCK